MRKWKERPCNACRAPGACPGVECGRWQVWFLDAWKDCNRKAVAQVRTKNRLREDKLYYGLPHEARDPCQTCPVEQLCEVPCQRRLWWWDRCMEKIRRRISR